ncbi:MAG: choice-of-anchor V domain-containing protein [Saprospiraceae bacterium]
MKFKFIYTFFGLATALFLGLGNTGGAGAVQNADRTNGPAADGFCGNSFCHDDGQFSPTLDIQLLADGTPVENYVPGETYTLAVTINASGSPAEYGFQAVALDESDANTGSFGTPVSGQQITTLGNGNSYWEHQGAQNTNAFEIEWTAPADAAGAITFYSAGIAANDGNGSGGDGAANSSLSVAPMVSSVFGVEALPVQVQISPNPVQDIANVQISTAERSELQLNIFNTNGQLVQNQTANVAAGDHQLEVNTTDLAAGIYHLQLTDGERVKTVKMLKK